MKVSSAYDVYESFAQAIFTSSTYYGLDLQTLKPTRPVPSCLSKQKRRIGRRREIQNHLDQSIDTTDLEDPHTGLRRHQRPQTQAPQVAHQAPREELRYPKPNQIDSKLPPHH